MKRQDHHTIMDNRLCLKFHDAVIEIESGYGEFLSHVARHLPNLICTVPSKPQIRVHLTYLHGTEKDHSTYQFSGAEQLERIGYRTFLTDGRIDWNQIWEVPGLKMSVQQGGDLERIQATFHELRVPNYGLHLLKRAIRRGYFRERKSMILDLLTEYLVYFPACWHLERFRDRHLIHAGAVLCGGIGILLPGRSSVGKSTISSLLLTRHGGHLLSDNLVLHDDRRIYACPEPILLSSWSKDLCGDAKNTLIPSGVSAVYNREGYFVEAGRMVDEMLPQIALFLRLGHSPSLREMSKEEGVSEVLDANTSTGETQRYYSYSAVMNALTYNGVLFNNRISHLRSLLTRVQCFELRIRMGDNLAEQIESLIVPLLGMKS